MESVGTREEKQCDVIDNYTEFSKDSLGHCKVLNALCGYILRKNFVNRVPPKI